LNIRHFRSSDVDALLRLSDLAGWNQTAQDVLRLLTLQPPGCFAACEGEQVVGTTTTTAYGADLAWVGMVLVDPDFRRRGIATALMERALDFVRGRGVRTIKLDATPAGRLVYERLGFEPERVLERWAGTLSGERVDTVALGGWDDIAAVDRTAFGADRGPLLRAMIADAGPPLVVKRPRGVIAGYALARLGARAAYLGPVVADELSTARALILAGGLRGAVYIDIDPAFPGATDLLHLLGFARQRELVRMRLGPDIRTDAALRVFAIAGPEVG
jgi:GNAT superfamily N-acetyltransferase